MEGDLKVMADLKNQIERGRSNFKKSPKDRITESYILARLEGLEDLIKRFSNKHESIISSYDSDDLAKSGYIQNDVFNMGYESYLMYKSELKTLLSSQSRVSTNLDSSTSYTPTHKDSLVRLPKICIPVFSGNYAEWSSFKDLFISLIHNNSALDDVQRLHYLKTQLKGEAEQLIKHIPITQANYVKCWDLLQSRYNNKRFMSNCILKRLFSQKTMNSESSSGIKDLLDTTSDCIHELSNLGINVESWDILIIYIVSLKLDAETRKQWELHINNLSEELPTFIQFKEFLECRFRALEFVEPVRLKPKVYPTTSNHSKSLHTMAGVTCPHCAENHKLFSCNKFIKETVNRRQDIVKTLGLCFNCLGINHTEKTCRVPTTCRVCKKKHHTLLHGNTSLYTVAIATEATETDDEDEKTQEGKEDNPTDEANHIATHFAMGQMHKQTLLATALIKVESKNNNSQVLRALLDQGSQASFISEAAVQLLRLDKIAEKSCVSGLGGGQSDLTSKYTVIVNMQSLHDPTFKLQIKAHVLNKVTSTLPQRKVILPYWADLSKVVLADPEYNTPNKIDILLGAEVYCSILKQGLIKHPKGLIIAQNTSLGWVLSGQVNDGEDTNNKCHNIIVNMHVVQETNELIKQFWELESEPKWIREKVLSSEEQACEDHFNKTTSRDQSGRYIVELPFRLNANSVGRFGDTRSIAVKRLLSLEKRLVKSPEQRKNYEEVINEYISLDHMEEVATRTELAQEGNKVWLPHHAVIRMDKSTTKTRVVFNASDRSANGVSLNDTLMVGPTLQPELRHIIMRWRLHPICLTADIIKMYRQVKVAAKHVDYQRIVWRDSTESEIKDYRLLRVTFGTSCAPYLAVKTLQQVAIDEGSNFPLAADRVNTDFYMDDLMTGCQSETEAIEIYKQLTSLLEKGGFILQKWASNRTELVESLKENKGKDMEIKEDHLTKILGLTWNRRSDDFDYTVKLVEPSAPETKRKIIAEICRLYDPIGWIAPCIITAKVFIQKLWLTGLDWDEKIPDDLLEEWSRYRTDLSKIVHFHLPRWVQRLDSDKQVELHGFSDASNVAYAAAVYIRCVSSTGVVESHLVTAKTKVAPIKQVSIPRLELCGAVLVTKLLLEVAEILNINQTDLHAWTDSTIVLAWLSDHPSRWKTFVANRTSEILSRLDASQWAYVSTKDNPADCASRGITPTALMDNQLWKRGPNWLRNETINYVKPSSICTKTDLEMRTIKAYATSINNESDLKLDARFSSLRKLVRVVAFCRRFLRLKYPIAAKERPLPYLTAKEIQDSLTSCIRQHQAQSFGDDIASILKTNTVSKKSKLVALNPFLDEKGILRVGGRLVHSNTPDVSKHPIIIFGESYLAKLIIADAHEKTMHGGQQLTCNYIRSKYWVIKLKNAVKNHIHGCVPCIRNAGTIRTQLMGQLPACRVTPGKPFLNSGVDYAGPINIRVSKGRGHKSYKGYICLFICMATRAVHIEAVTDLTSEGFLSAFKRFVARRGRCNHIWSDNGSNFIGAARELKQLFASEQSVISKSASSLANSGTEWHFIPPYAPNFGGLWEAGIKSTKHHLRRVIGDSTLTYEELSTVLAQVEACLNSRPLSIASPDPDDPAPLTPGHFLIGEALITAPDYNYEQIQMSSLRRWQLTQRMLQGFWKRWSQEYLTHFFQRYKWNVKTPELKVGDVVLVREDNLPPTKWLYGRVIDLHPGKDKITRVVTLRYRDSVIQRPASKVCTIPVVPHAE